MLIRNLNFTFLISFKVVDIKRGSLKRKMDRPRLSSITSTNEHKYICIVLYNDSQFRYFMRYTFKRFLLRYNFSMFVYTIDGTDLKIMHKYLILLFYGICYEINMACLSHVRSYDNIIDASKRHSQLLHGLNIYAQVNHK